MRELADRASRPRLGDRYEIRRRLGAGGMAEVFHAWDQQLERDVTIKVLREKLLSSPAEVDRFRREALLLANVDSDHVIQIYDSHVEAQECYLVLRHVVGRSLDRIIEGGPLALGCAIQIALDVLDGLRDLHAGGVVHRDVKPANVLVDHHDRAILLDLGVARDRRRRGITPPTRTVGTVGFMAPEQRLSSHVDPRSDLYQVGLLLLYMTTTIDPRHLHPDALGREMLLWVPPGLVAVIKRALLPPDERFQDVDEMAAALHAIVDIPETVELSLDDIESVESEKASENDEPILLDRRKSRPHEVVVRRHPWWPRIVTALALAVVVVWSLGERLDIHAGVAAATPPTRPRVARAMPPIRHDVSTPAVEVVARQAAAPPVVASSSSPAVPRPTTGADMHRPTTRSEPLDSLINATSDGEGDLLRTAYTDELNGSTEEAIAAFRRYLREESDPEVSRIVQAHIDELVQTSIRGL